MLKTPTDLPEILHDMPPAIKRMLTEKFHAGNTAGQRVEKLQKTSLLLRTFHETSEGDPLIGEKMAALYTYAREKGHSHVSFTIRSVLGIELPQSALGLSLDK
ncbi:MAG TPA: hypothetical protein PKX38_07260 [Alphaproteobacteria bacterium]|nr:hypothetical protein [Micavibrio sp.]MBK9562843.1 hypothetical protein [Micavibrio sp.]HQX27719.1 hypothetical protein [Alphaproteobacteria bacterium]